MIVGIDIGTQSLKAVVTDAALRPRGEAATAYRPSFPRPGHAEQDPGLWERALAPTIARALAAAGAPAAEARALGIAGQLDGCVAVDARGRPLGPCLVWMDRRAEAELAGLPAEAVRERSGVVVDATHMAAKIRWLKRHAAPAREAVCFHQPVSYLVERLTGARVFDHGLASTTMLYGLRQRALDPWLLDLFAIAADELPAVAEAEGLAGRLTADGARLTGLPAGTAVAVGTGDDFATPLGAGLVAAGPVACVLGTAEVVGALHHDAVIDDGGLVETHAYPGRLHLVENPGWLSGGAVAWLVETLRLAGAAELDHLAAGVAPGADGLAFLPALSGAMAPEWIAGARGCFYGLTPAHGAGHLGRALLEGCAFAMRDVLERLQALGVATRSVLLLGGGARSRLWAQMRADLCGLPVEVPAIVDTCPLGAAALAAVAGGIMPDLARACACLGGDAQLFEPDRTRRSAYDAAYRRYRRLFESLRPMYEAPA